MTELEEIEKSMRKLKERIVGLEHLANIGQLCMEFAYINPLIKKRRDEILANISRLKERYSELSFRKTKLLQLGIDS